MDNAGGINKQDLISAIKNQIKYRRFKNIDEFHTFISNIDRNNIGEKLTNEEKNELETVFNETLKSKEAPTITTGVNYENILHQLEQKIRDNQFESKEALVDYINKLKSEGVPPEVLTEEKIAEYLELYDQLSVNNTDALDIRNYKGAQLEKQNVIVSKQDAILLKTSNTPEELPLEFKSNQNELTAKKDDGLSNADEVFDYMRNYKKEEMTLITIDEALSRGDIDSEMLEKIKFFVTNKYINPYAYRINIKNGVFYGIETGEVLEVRKDPETGEYSIYKGGQKVYGDEKNKEIDLQEDKKEEKKIYENKEKEAIKVRTLTKPKLNNNAFVQGGLLFIISIAVALLTALIMLMYH